jgi:hypothetical protein
MWRGKHARKPTNQDKIVGAPGDLGGLVVMVDDVATGRSSRQRRGQQQRQDSRGGHLSRRNGDGDGQGSCLEQLVVVVG